MYTQENLTGRLNEKTSYGETHPNIAKNIGKEIKYNKKTIFIESAHGEIVWITIRDTKGKVVINDYECNQIKILEIIEGSEVEVNPEKIAIAKKFSGEFEQYRKSKQSL